MLHKYLNFTYLFIVFCLVFAVLLALFSITYLNLQDNRYDSKLTASPLEKKGKLSQRNSQVDSTIALATLAGGCFWCVEATLEKVRGVKSVVSGYSGGISENPTYKSVSAGVGGHVEAVQVRYNQKVVGYSKILEHFLRIIDPTDDGGQFADRGYSYRPFIFYHNSRQKHLAINALRKLTKSKRFKLPLRVPVVAYKNFYRAEEYHQDYYRKNPEHYKRYFYGSGRAAFIQRVWGTKRLP